MVTAEKIGSGVGAGAMSEQAVLIGSNATIAKTIRFRDCKGVCILESGIPSLYRVNRLRICGTP